MSTAAFFIILIPRPKDSQEGTVPIRNTGQSDDGAEKAFLDARDPTAPMVRKELT